MKSPLSSLVELPPDPVIGVTEAFRADSRPDKVNLGVGVYFDEAGKLARFQSIQRAEEALHSRAEPKAYLPIDGLPEFNTAIQELILGADSSIIRDGRAITVQALGGTGALRVGADLLKLALPDAQIWISDPSWENHQALFTKAGFQVRSYAYYDPVRHSLNFEAMLESLRAIPAGSIIVLHACCHNPTGVDLKSDQWEAVKRVVTERALLPFFDFAYQGFGAGIAEDAWPVRDFAASGLPMLIANSFSKSCSMYGERVGGLTVIADDKAEAKRVLTQVKRVIRTNYSNPPSHGAKLVAAVLCDPGLRPLWEAELEAIRIRIRSLRALFVQTLQTCGLDRDFSFVQDQVGMFSYTGISAEEVRALRAHHGVYMLETGRICVAAMNKSNIDKVCSAIVAVLKAR